MSTSRRPHSARAQAAPTSAWCTRKASPCVTAEPLSNNARHRFGVRGDRTARPETWPPRRAGASIRPDTRSRRGAGVPSSCRPTTATKARSKSCSPPRSTHSDDRRPREQRQRRCLAGSTSRVWRSTGSSGRCAATWSARCCAASTSCAIAGSAAAAARSSTSPRSTRTSPTRGAGTTTAPRALTRTLSLEVAEHGINVNNLAPGMVFTPFNQPAIDDPQLREQQVSASPSNARHSPRRSPSSRCFSPPATPTT